MYRSPRARLPRRAVLRSLLVATAAGMLLGGCLPGQVGTAVSVGDERLSIAELQERSSTLLEEVGAPEEVGAAAQALAATFFVRTQLLEEALQERDITVTDGNVATLRAEIAGTPQEQQLRQAATNSGVPLSDFDRFLRNALLSQRLAEALADTPGGATEGNLALALREAAEEHPVTVNPRYGVWDPELLYVNPEGAELSTDLAELDAGLDGEGAQDGAPTG